MTTPPDRAEAVASAGPPPARGVPTLETERLTLHAHREGDRAESAAMWADPQVTRFIGGRPATAEAAWSRLLTYAGLWATLGYGFGSVRERATGLFVGEVGLADFRRDLTPAFDGAPEVGWAFVPRAWGRGFGSEAVAAALAWSDAHLPGMRTLCLISPENEALLRLAARHGFREYARTRCRDAPVLLFERFKAPRDAHVPALAPSPAHR